MTVNSTNNTRNAVEIRAELSSNGTTVEYIIINGLKCGILGSVGEKDKQNAIRAIQTALDASNGNIYEMMRNFKTIATIEDKEISADEMVEINGAKIIISYKDKTAHTIDGKEIADCKDLPDMPNEAIKAVLMARVETKIVDNDDYYDDDDYDY